jgi:hypothetical protein
MALRLWAYGPSSSPYLSVRVEHGEVGDDDRDRKCDRENAGQGAERSNEHAEVRLGHHVSVAHRGHGHNGPPEALRDALEVVVRVRLPLRGKRSLIIVERIITSQLHRYMTLWDWELTGTSQIEKRIVTLELYCYKNSSNLKMDNYFEITLLQELLKYKNG